VGTLARKKRWVTTGRVVIVTYKETIMRRVITFVKITISMSLKESERKLQCKTEHDDAFFPCSEVKTTQCQGEGGSSK
jgi:hypothetical protein